MITTTVDDAAYRLATMIDFCSALGWSPDAPPVFALMFRPAQNPDDVRTVFFPLETSIPDALTGCEPDGECLALCISCVFRLPRPGRRPATTGGLVRMTMAVTDCGVAAVHRYPSGRVNRTADVGALLQAQLHGMWEMRIRFELARRRTSPKSSLTHQPAA